MWMQADVMGDMEGFGVEQLAKSINGTGGQCCLALGVFFLWQKLTEMVRGTMCGRCTSNNHANTVDMQNANTSSFL